MNQVHALLRSAYAYSRNIFGKGIGIAVLDTGVWAGHRQILPVLWILSIREKSPTMTMDTAPMCPGSLPEAGRRPEGCIWALRPCPG